MNDRYAYFFRIYSDRSSEYETNIEAIDQSKVRRRIIWERTQPRERETQNAFSWELIKVLRFSSPPPLRTDLNTKILINCRRRHLKIFLPTRLVPTVSPSTLHEPSRVGQYTSFPHRSSVPQLWHAIHQSDAWETLIVRREDLQVNVESRERGDSLAKRMARRSSRNRLAEGGEKLITAIYMLIRSIGLSNGEKIDSSSGGLSVNELTEREKYTFSQLNDRQG